MKKPTIGFEPITSGLQNRSSTVELRWRNFYIGRIIQKMRKFSKCQDDITSKAGV